MLESFIPLLGALGYPLFQFSMAPNTACGFVAARALHVFSTILDVMEVFFHALEPLASDQVVNHFVDNFNVLVNVYNSALLRTQALLAAGTVTTHP